MNIFVHAAYVGNTGYNSHCQNFFRNLSTRHNIKIRNFTIGKNWLGFDGSNKYPHGNDVNELDTSLIGLQTLWNQKNELEDFEIHDFNKQNFKHDINIILAEVNHHYFYQEYLGPKIAYTAWESTSYPDSFFRQLKTFDQIWVPTEWQAEITEKQGISRDKIKVVREGVDTTTFHPDKTIKNDKFRFVIFGRWDGRKATTEIIRAFKNIFGNNSNVELLISVDNPFSVDGMNSTEERLKKYDLESDNIKVLHFPTKEKYVEILKNADVFLSCSRSEGWNLPLIEAMACGIPSIYSDCSGQLEFAKNKGIPVKISREISIKELDDPFFKMVDDLNGNWYEPDFQDLELKMFEVYKNYEFYKNQALADSVSIREEFTWERAAEKASQILNSFSAEYSINYIGETDDGNGIKYSASTPNDQKIIIRATNVFTNQIVYEECLFINNRHVFWTSCNRDGFPLLFEIVDFYTKEVKFKKTLDLREFNLDFKDFSFSLFPQNRKKIIINESGSLGDFIAWTPIVASYARKNNLEVDYYTPYKSLLERTYPEINFIDYSQKNEINVDDQTINIGCFSNLEWQKMNLQEVASTILNIKHEEIRPRLSSHFKKKNNFDKKYVCIATQSTAQCKYWNNKNGWQKVVDYLKLLDYEVVCIDKHAAYGSSSSMNIIPKNCIDKTGDIPLEDRINDLMHCEFFIGLGSGLSWLAWACGKPVIMISGFSDAKSEFYTPYRVINKNVCNSCLNDPTNTFDPSNWLWCPRNKNFECSREITFKMVKEKIDECIRYVDGEELSWGLTNDWFKKTIKKEIFENRIYEKFFPVEASDIVVDFGASIGPFAKSILHKKPSQIYCFEPSENMYDQLSKNLHGENVTLLNYAISNRDGNFDSSEFCLFSASQDQKKANSMTFATFISKFNVKKINFLKTDCEGGEYDIFTEENRDWILQNVDKIAGEWHLSNEELKNKFKKFRDIYLRGDNFWITSVDGVDIKWNLWRDDFIEYYNEIIIYIKNR